MRIPPLPHPWRLAPRAAMSLQQQLAGRVRVEKPRGPLRCVAGLDAAFSPDGRHCIGAVILWELGSGQVLEAHTAIRRVTFPYIPGLLSFREAPALLATLRQLRQAPDVLLCDGQGYAHPRRFGIACHLGILCNLPAAGCAKSRLIGDPVDPGPRRGDRALLQDGDEVVGMVLRTRPGVKPVYVSVGHRIDLASACQLVLGCARAYRLPEPTRLADRRVAAVRRLAFA